MFEAGKEKLKELFGIDLRSLALFRIGLALLLIGDLLIRGSDLVAFYTDKGILPRAVLLHTPSQSPAPLGLFFFTGGPLWPAFLFGVAGIFALLLLVGYRTRFVTFVSWFLLISQHDRNPMILQGGDVVFRMLLFWGLFLPLGARFSVDRLLHPPSPAQKRNFSVGSCALLLQVCFIYWFSVVYKWNEEWLSNMAVYYALNIDQFATPLGLWLRQQETLLPLLTRLTLLTEMVGPCLAFIPIFVGPIRTGVVALFFLLHLSFDLFLTIGLFPYICMVAWIVFLPPWFWDNVVPRFTLHKKLLQPLKKISTSWSQAIPKLFSQHSLPHPNIPPTFFENVLAGFFLCYIFLHNMTELNAFHMQSLVSKKVLTIGDMLHLNQRWNMFSHPLKQDGWYLIPAKLLSGREVDLFRGGAPITWEKPPVVSSLYKTYRWRKYMSYLWWKRFSSHRLYYAQHLCRHWNSTHTGLQKLHSFQIYYMLETTHKDKNQAIAPPQKILLWSHNCFGKPKEESK